MQYIDVHNRLGWCLALRHALGNVAQNELMKPRILKRAQGNGELPLFDLFDNETLDTP